MFNVYVATKHGYDVEYICNELDGLHFMVLMLETNKYVQHYSVQEWGKEYDFGLMKLNKKVPLKLFNE